MTRQGFNQRQAGGLKNDREGYTTEKRPPGPTLDLAKRCLEFHPMALPKPCLWLRRRHTRARKGPRAIEIGICHKRGPDIGGGAWEIKILEFGDPWPGGAKNHGSVSGPFRVEGRLFGDPDLLASRWMNICKTGDFPGERSSQHTVLSKACRVRKRPSRRPQRPK